MSQDWTIPLQIRITIGAPVPVTETPAATAPAGTQGIPLLTATAARGAEERADEPIPHLDKFAPSSLVATSFSYSTALALALAAKLVYSKPAIVNKTVEETWRLGNFEFFNVDDTQCFVAATDKVVLVSFRGTEALGDWVANLNLLTTKRPYGAVHRGFLGALQVVQGKLEATLDRLVAGGRTVVVTGHSLGGALAVVAAAEWRDKYKVSWVHTCGQPAVGTREFLEFAERKYGQRYVRFVNDDDLVPMVPPRPYEHAGRLIHFDGDGELESAMVTDERKALNLPQGPTVEETPTMEKDQFDFLRAQLLQHRALQGGVPPSDAAVEEAARNAVLATTDAQTEGFLGLPSVADHDMNKYIKKIARHALK